MSTLGEFLREMSVNAEEGTIPIRAERCPKATSSPIVSIRDEQIRALVQQLFFRQEGGLVRNVVFASAEPSMPTASLCLDVARALAEEGKYDVGLIDASSETIPLQEQLDIQVPMPATVKWPVLPRLRLVPRQSWWPEAGLQPMTDQNLERLRELMGEFDFSIVSCTAVCSITARIGHNCDGLVLVLTANRTRRLVAAQIKEQLEKIRVPLPGTILADRRFPVPQGLYRSL